MTDLKKISGLPVVTDLLDGDAVEVNASGVSSQITVESLRSVLAAGVGQAKVGEWSWDDELTELIPDDDPDIVGFFIDFGVVPEGATIDHIYAVVTEDLTFDGSWSDVFLTMSPIADPAVFAHEPLKTNVDLMYIAQNTAVGMFDVRGWVAPQYVPVATDRQLPVRVNNSGGILTAGHADIWVTYHTFPGVTLTQADWVAIASD